MEVHIDEIVSHITAVDDDALLSPEVLTRIVEAVLAAVREERTHERRVEREHESLGNLTPRGGRP